MKGMTPWRAGAGKEIPTGPSPMVGGEIVDDLTQYGDNILGRRLLRGENAKPRFGEVPDFEVNRGSFDSGTTNVNSQHLAHDGQA